MFSLLCPFFSDTQWFSWCVCKMKTWDLGPKTGISNQRLSNWARVFLRHLLTRNQQCFCFVDEAGSNYKTKTLA